MNRNDFCISNTRCIAFRSALAIAMSKASNSNNSIENLNVINRMMQSRYEIFKNNPTEKYYYIADGMITADIDDVASHRDRAWQEFAIGKHFTHISDVSVRAEDAKMYKVVTYNFRSYIDTSVNIAIPQDANAEDYEDVARHYLDTDMSDWNYNEHDISLYDTELTAEHLDAVSLEEYGASNCLGDLKEGLKR